jgi:ABC-type Na+ efflux pump permease subunit
MPISVAGKMLAALNFLIAILAFWIVLNPLFKMCDTVSENGTLRVGDPPFDLADLAVLIGAVVAFLLPLFAVFRARSVSRDNRHLDWSIAFIALIGTWYWAGMTYDNLGPKAGPFMLATLSMTGGCLFGMIVFLLSGSSRWKSRPHRPDPSHPLINQKLNESRLGNPH